MKRLRALIMVTFGFSRSEARAFLILLPLVFLIVFSEPVYQAWYLSGNPDNFSDANKLDSLLATWNFAEDSIREKPATSLFSFNPNTVSLSEMDSLGIPSSVSMRIERYRTKGGKFKVRSDFGKMYGLDSSLFAKLAPFINLPKNIPKKEAPVRLARTTDGKPASKTLVKFDLNAADTAALNSIFGIGPALAKRIVLYRDRLGGFVIPDQLYEVWGLDSLVVQRTQQQSEILYGFSPKKININVATERELASHPYMKPKIARIIVTYRFQHGNFTSIEDLEQINLIDTKTFNRIKPYLTLE